MAQPNDHAVPDESGDGDHLTASSGSESAYDATLHYDLSDSPEPGTAAGVSFEARLGDTSQPAVDCDQTIETSSSATSNPSESPAPQVAGRYVLQGEIARGGMGAIFSARDEVLGRDLAIKVLLDSHVDSPETGRRFIEEAQINGQLQHPGIVPVHELGTLEDRRPFFAMKLVKGQTLKALLAERPDPRSDLSRFLGVFEHICLTMAYAHDRGVIHRDLKPANVMVGAFGEVQVMDWGLAKVITGGTKPAEEPTVSDELSVIRTIRNSGSGASSGSESHTQFGWAIGTPAYMPPEQALGEVERMDERADVFGLGAILCEILTGTPPYVNDQRRDIMRMAMRGETTECFARLDNSGAEQPLIDLAKECLAFDIAARPRNAKVVADRLTQHLESVATRLRQSELDLNAAQTRAQEQRKRQRIVLALGACVVAIAATAGGIVSWIQKERADFAQRTSERLEELAYAEAASAKEAIAARDREANLKVEAENARREVELTLADVYTSRGLLAAEAPDPPVAMMWFTLAAKQAKADPDRESHNARRARNWANEATLPVGAFFCESAAERVHFQPGGHQLLIQMGPNGQYVLWDWRTNEKSDWLHGQANVNRACWAPDGSAIAVVGDQSIEIREVATGVARQSIAYPAEVTSIEFSPDGRLLAIGGESARIWNVAENRLLDQQWPHPHRIDSLKFNRAGTRLITTAEDKLARVFAVDDVGRPAPLYDPLPHVPERPPSSPVLVNGDRQLVTIANYGQLAVWDLETGSEQKRITTKPKALCLVAADPLGRFFATGGYYGPSLWRADAMDDPPVEMDHVNFVDHIVFSADGTLMMSVSWDSTAQLWSVPDGRPLGPRITHNTGAHRVAISDDNQYLVTSQDNRLVRVWKRPDTTRLIARTPKWGKMPRLSSDGLLATPGRFYASPLVEHGTTPEVVVRRTSDGAPIGPTIRDGRMVVDTCICGDNRTLAIVSQGNQGAKLTLWDPYAGQQIRDPMDLPGVPLSVAARPATDHLVIVCQRDTLLAVDWKTGSVLFTHSGEAKSLSDDIPDGRFASYTPDGKRIVAMTDNISARVYDADSGELCFPPLQAVYEERLPFRTFSISPDNRLLATGANGVARVWDLGNGRELCRPLLHPDNQLALSDLEFSPDNRLLITANTDGLARVWDWQQGELACPPLKHDDVVFTVAFTPDGRHAVTGSRGPHCGPHVWELTTGKPIAPPLIDPQGGSNKDAVHGVAIAPDGSRLVAGASSSGDFVIADLQRLLASTDIPVEDLQLVSEAAATKAIEAGDLNTLTLEQWRTRWSRLTENRLARETASPLEIMRRRTKLAADAQARGDFDEALRQLQIAWEASESETFDPNGPNAVQIAAGLADIQFRQVSIYRTTQRHAEFTEALERARVWAEQALALDPHNHSRRTQLTGVLWLVGEGQPTNPLDSQLRNAVRILGSNTISSLAAVYLLAGEPDNAVSIIQQIDAERLTAIDLALLAIGQQRLEQTAEASEALERGLNALAELNFPESAMALAESALVEIKGITLDEANAHVRQLKTAHALKPFDEAIASAPESPRGYANRGEWHGAHGNWELAAADLSKAIEIEPEDHFSAYHLCSLFAARENADAYRAHRTMMLAKWGESREDTIAERTAMGCLLREPSVDELEQLKEIMQYVEEVTPTSRFRIWFTRCIALYRYRLGQYEDALKATQQGRNWIGPNGAAVLEAGLHSIDALAHAKLGDVEKANASLAAANDLFENKLPPATSGRIGPSWHDSLMGRLLYEEARALLVNE